MPSGSMRPVTRDSARLPLLTAPRRERGEHEEQRAATSRHGCAGLAATAAVAAVALAVPAAGARACARCARAGGPAARAGVGDHALADLERCELPRIQRELDLLPGAGHRV